MSVEPSSPAPTEATPEIVTSDVPKADVAKADVPKAETAATEGAEPAVETRSATEPEVVKADLNPKATEPVAETQSATEPAVAMKAVVPPEVVVAKRPPIPRGAGTDFGRDVVIHEYDGIEECDNQLPRWWLWCLYGTVIFAAGYWLHYHTFQSGKLPGAAYEAEITAARAVRADRMKNEQSVTPEMLTSLSKDEATLKQGREAFAQNCVACHAATGGGGIGPNLTDGYWIHGGAPDKIYQTIRDGFVMKGMAAWGPVLGEPKVRAVAAFVLTLKNTNVAGGKPPQGDKEP